VAGHAPAGLKTFLVDVPALSLHPPYSLGADLLDMVTESGLGFR
jgi:hypothetical protein